MDEKQREKLRSIRDRLAHLYDRIDFKLALLDGSEIQKSAPKLDFEDLKTDRRYDLQEINRVISQIDDLLE